MLNLKKANKRTNKVSEIVLEMVISEDSRKITKLGGRRKAVDGPFPQGAPGEAALTDPLVRGIARLRALCPLRFGPPRATVPAAPLPS